jgi:hypothetical protein
MGQKKKQPKSDVLFELSRMLVPRDLLAFFDIVEVKELHSEWQVTLHEKDYLIPDKLSSERDVVLDGFCNPLTVLSHGFSTKPVYLVIKRRRWKRSGHDGHYSNQYVVSEDAAKVAPDMAGFLKI